MPASLTPDLGDPGTLNRIFAPALGASVIGLAVSGGADSLALMVLAKSWAQANAEMAPRVIVYTLDHGLRAEAAAETAMVAAEASRLGLAVRSLSWAGAKPRTGLQEAARQARYRIIGEAMATDGATLLLTAHHRSDQAETLLMRLAHGSGIEGLKGMSTMAVVEGVTVFRPFLDVDPMALASVVAASGLTPAQDPSNTDKSYERVRWRERLPLLAEDGLDASTLARFAARMAEADAALSQMADAAFGELVSLDGFGAATADLGGLSALSPALGRRVLLRTLKIVGGRQKPRALGPVERLYDQIVSGELPRSTTLLGAVIRLRDGMLFVSREPGRSLPADRPLPPRAGLVWDHRFLITNVSEDKTLIAGVSDFLPRHRLENILGFKVTTPAEAIRTAPVVRDAEGGVLALGGWSFDERIKVELLID